MRRLILSLCLFGCDSAVPPGVEGPDREITYDPSTDGGKSHRDAESDRDFDSDGERGDGDIDDGREQVDGAGKDAGNPPEGQDAGTLDDEVHCFQKSCPADSTSSARMGETPYGTFRIQKAGSTYTTGFTNATSIHLIGDIDGDYADFIVEALNGSWPEYVTPPGTYSTQKNGQSGAGNGQNGWVIIPTLRREGADAVCSDQGPAPATVELTIQKHVAAGGTIARGEAMSLIGEIKVTGGGWNLQAPFNIGTLCDSYTSL